MESNDFQNAAIPSKTERQWAMGCHLIALCGIIVPIASANLLGPLVLWLIKRVDGEFIDDQGKESLNFQISLFLYALLGWLFLFIGGWVVVLAVRFIGFIFVIIAAVKASEGVAFRYPACIRFIK
ncbi:DUF4870 domain-containing protein [Pontiella sulfatireligans]|uniref:Orotate phosphoribosyltransferase n=1 Tax=Pontiella sulfatireligans TaxID=2750658 RepID=A0A6C2URW4_9BACT|nr:DUF4870 domain-containing protein [Pontiella sulfatireligans]VGO22998.1 hypothetical protein SCARR_05097 [Pontiella sulfatireligans]